MKNIVILLIITINGLYGQKKYEFKNAINCENIKIYRDKWGVPHIHGKTDAEASYGLAWAHAEDDFATIQKTYLMAKHTLGRVTGKEGAKIDYVHQLLRLDELVDKQFYTIVSEDFLKILEGYCQGLNDYAQKHPKEILYKKLFPIQPKDVLKGYALSIALMSGLDRNIKGILNGKVWDAEAVGASNAFAFSRKKIVEGLTTVVINAHQPLEGQVAFYEAHMISDEGMNIHGGTFPGAVSILHGVTPHYAWAHTTNQFDKIDVYQLTMKSPKSNQYLYDNEWLKLEVKKAKLKVKMGFLVIPISKKTYWSRYGATLKSKHGVFSLRLAANQELRVAEQWYKMGKCKNFQEFYEVLKMQAIPAMNITYGDKEDNIFFIANGLIPNRKTEEVNWACAVPGNTSKTYWEGFMDIKNHPQVLNPSCGYVFNVNHTPFQCTGAGENPRPEDYPCKLACFEMEDNNRSLRFRELYKDGDTISIPRLKAIKYDLFFPQKSTFMDLVYRMQNLDEKYPEYKDICNIFKKWNRSMDTTNVQATIFYLAFVPIFKQFDYSTKLFMKKYDLSDSLLLEGLKFAKEYLIKHFGTLELRFGDLLRHRRGNKDYAIGGFPDVMASMMGLPDKDGKFKAMRGEDLIIYAYFNENGLQKIESIKAYGNSSKKNSPHYNDQMELYLKNGTKTMTLDLKTIQNNAIISYQPNIEVHKKNTNTHKKIIF